MGLWEMQYLDDEGDQILWATEDLVATINFACISSWKVNIQ